MDSDKIHHHHHHHKPSPLADDSTVQSSFSSTSLTSNHEARAARTVDAQFQNKALSRSVVAESLDFFLPKPNPTFLRSVSDTGKLSQSHPQLQSAATKPELNPEKERRRKKFYGGEVVKLIYYTGKGKASKKADAVKGGQHEKDVDDVKKRLAKLEIVDAEKINGVRDMKRVSAGRRRSFSGMETSLSSFFSSNGARIVAVDMPPFMQIHAIDCARKAYDSLEKFTSKSLALSLKKEFDGAYGPAWHCIVGTSFGSFVTHSVGGFLYFSLDHKMHILLFKTTVQRAD